MMTNPKCAGCADLQRELTSAKSNIIRLERILSDAQVAIKELGSERRAIVTALGQQALRQIMEENR